MSDSGHDLEKQLKDKTIIQHDFKTLFVKIWPFLYTSYCVPHKTISMGCQKFYAWKKDQQSNNNFILIIYETKFITQWKMLYNYRL